MDLKNISKYTYFSLLPMLLLGAAAIALVATGFISAVFLVGTLTMWSLISGLGIAVGYHRVFSHRTHQLPSWKQAIILYFAALGGQGSAITWAAIHRLHHKAVDTEKDPHSPVFKGRWFAFYTWSSQITEANPISMKYAVDLVRSPLHLWFHRHQLKIMWGTVAAVAVVNWHAALVCLCLPTAISLLQDNLTNVFGHTKSFLSYRNFETPDRTQNQPILGYLGWGQGWHNNHHAHPANFDFGNGTSGKWWEFDPSRLWLWFLGDANAEKRSSN